MLKIYARNDNFSKFSFLCYIIFFGINLFVYHLFIINLCKMKRSDIYPKIFPFAIALVILITFVEVILTFYPRGYLLHFASILIVIIAYIFYLKTEKERKRSEKLIIENEKKFRTIFDTNPAPITITRIADGKIVNANKAFYEITGLTPDEVINQTTVSLKIWDDEKNRNRFVEILKHKGFVKNYRAFLHKKNGEKIIGLISAKILDLEHQDYMLAITHDITEIVEVEEQLRRDEQLLNSIMNSPEGLIVFALDSDFRYLYFSDRHKNIMQQIFGTNAKIEKGVNILDIIHSEANKERLKQNFKRVLSGENFVIEEEFGAGKNKQVWENHYAPIKNDNGEIIGITVFVIDITLRKKAESEISILFQVVEQTPVSVVITDLAGNIEYVNPYFTKITGYEKEEIIGENPRILKSGKHSKEFYEKLWGKITNKQVWSGEFINKRKDGTLYWEEAVITPIVDKNGDIIKYSAMKTDITERKKIEAELQKYREDLEKIVAERTKQLNESLETFRALTENSLDAILRFDKDGRFLYANPNLLRITRLKEEDIIGKTYKDLAFSEKFVQEWDDTMEQIFVHKKNKRVEMHVPKFNLWIDWLIVPEIDENGVVVAGMASGRDISQIKKIEQELERMLQKEKEINELKTQFISMVSHEFRTPLTSIFSSIDLLEMFDDKWSREKKKKQFEQMRASIQRLTEMLNNVLQISRMERGKLELNFEPTDIQKFTSSFMEEVNQILTPKHTFTKKIELKNKTYNLPVDTLRTIVLNIISNAVKYSPDGGNIQLEVKEKIENELEIIISDEGIGIDEKDLDKIFTEFYRAKNVMHIQGTGLGLAIVKSLVDKLNGKISVKSEVGKGTTFYITIPLGQTK